MSRSRFVAAGIVGSLSVWGFAEIAEAEPPPAPAPGPAPPLKASATAANIESSTPPANANCWTSVPPKWTYKGGTGCAATLGVAGAAVEWSATAGVSPEHLVTWDRAGTAIKGQVKLFFVAGDRYDQSAGFKPGLDAAKAHPDQAVFVVQVPGNNTYEIVTATSVDEAVSPPPSTTSVPSPWTVAECLTRLEKLAKEELDKVFCIDLVAGVQVLKAPADNIISPNEGLTIVLRHLADEVVSASIGKNRGITKPTSGNGALEAKGKEDVLPTAFSILRFGPHTAGSTDLVIQTTKAGENGEKDPRERLKLELEVDQRYWAAVRTGIGTLFGNFRGYEAITFEGSQQAQINEKFVPVQFELVLGFALFPETFGGEGRSYTGNGPNYYVSPYVGFGLIGQQIDSVDGFTSIHLGLDIEFTSDISLAVTAVGRRTKHLVDGYTTGSPVAAGSTAFLEDGIVFGGGLVVTATPDFLKVKK